METPLVTILTPVYNGEAYLRECIESVLKQTYSNWEYIIVNNQSKDRTLAIAEEYARREPRIRVHTNSEFVASIPNHNIAFRQLSPTSQFCKMVHADDWLFPECIEKMVAVATANPNVGFVSSYSLWGNKVKMDGLPYPSTVVSGREICRGFFLKNLWVFGCPTTSLIRSDIIRRAGAFYNERNIHADTEAGFAVLAHSDFGFVHQVLTFTRLHEESMTSKIAIMDTMLPGHLEPLLKYGSGFLTENEFAEIKRGYMRQYYRCLGRRALRLRDKPYWQFHAERLKQLGVSLNYFRVGINAVAEAFKFCFAPSRWGRAPK